jgi:hypothetical protein
MGIFDGLQDKAAGLLGDHADKLEGVTDAVVGKVGDAADAVTGGKFSDQIDAVQEKADGIIGE